MAAAAAQVVCPFFGVVFERLSSLIYNVQIKKLGPLVKEELTKLFKTFLKIKEVLDDAEEKQFNEKAVRVRFWLQELNGAAYEADDVFDELEYEEGLHQLASEEATSSSSSSNNITELHGKIQKLNKIFHELAEESSGLELQKEKEKSVVVSPELFSLSTEPQVYGRVEDREKLVKQLLGSAYLTVDQFHSRISKHPKTIGGAVQSNASSSSQGNISVFPILGMGGLGKTTLAQLVYHDKRVANHFKDRSWVCLSDDFDIKHLMKTIVASISESECNLEDLELLQQRLRKLVHGKRFLFVLDDVWEESQEEWNKLMGFFEGGARGSLIIVTTRLPTVASITSALPPHCLNGLSEKDCLALFKDYAFGPGNEEKETLVKIGRAIVRKCGGLPLAAKAMGGCIIGAAGTPYHDGLFFFDIKFPANYPAQPPQVHYKSYGLRLNPNLYANGTVCLSLLNTWTGTREARWNMKKSTILQVLVSIQALVLNEEPFYNEPISRILPDWRYFQKKALSYNEGAFMLSCLTMTYTLNRPPMHFKELVSSHFCDRAHAILTACIAYTSGGIRVGGHS